MVKFAEKKEEFNNKYKPNAILENSLVPIHGEYEEDISLYNSKGKPYEEYYKWQFIYAIINSGLYPKDNIGVECYFPKGNKNSASLKIDGCIFDDKEWIDYYKAWKIDKDFKAVEWLNEHLIGVIEFKREDREDIQDVYARQVRPAIKVSESDYCVGFYYDNKKLYIFERSEDGKILRYDEDKNIKGANSGINDLSLELPDKYAYIPSYQQITRKINKIDEIDVTQRTIKDLEPISSINSEQINNAMSNILKDFDRVGLVNQRGYELFIKVLALKMFDEKRNEKNLNYSSNETLDFYVSKEELNYTKISDKVIQNFIERIQNIYDEAEIDYHTILKSQGIDWKDENQLKAVISIVNSLQDYTFVRSIKRTDLYQLVFYRFANEFTKVDKAQFITPLQLIDFLVKIVNPKNGEKIIDPTVGIADFLSVSYINADGQIKDNDLYGVDVDEQMIMLSQLNMLLNGDGNAILKHKPGEGSLLYKFNKKKELVSLDPNTHEGGNWDKWADDTKLMKFDIVLTNPPFGENRKFKPKTDKEKKIANLYELWKKDKVGKKNPWIDPGILFLENAYRILKTNGRLGIVLSKSIASIDRWKTSRKWLMDNMRVVALFDLPQNVFADAGVETSLLIAYKPEPRELKKLKNNNYEIFVRDIKNIGYNIRTQDRVKYYNEIYKIDEETFEVIVDDNGEPIIDEDFTQTIEEFKDWAVGQEGTLKKLFL